MKLAINEREKMKFGTIKAEGFDSSVFWIVNEPFGDHAIIRFYNNGSLELADDECDFASVIEADEYIDLNEEFVKNEFRKELKRRSLTLQFWLEFSQNAVIKIGEEQ